MAWKSIETTPKDGTRILIKPRPGLVEAGLPPVMIGRWAERSGRWAFAEIAGRNVDPVSWHPIPE